MNFHSDVLQVLISVFFAVAAVSVTIAVVAVTSAVRDLRRPRVQAPPFIPPHRELTPEPARHAA
jgi:hypothetical protein